ncbi:MAG: hypothetical protein Q9222_003334 [Ikaeria aurantiellina]
MSFIARRGLSTLIPPKIASPSGIGAAQDAARMERVVSFYEKLPRGPAPEHKPKGLLERYQARYFGKNPSAAPLAHLIGGLMLFGYAQHYYFHFRSIKYLIMDLQNLSSNWKKLQATLKAEQSPTPKRKADEEVLQPNRNGTKEFKASTKQKIVRSSLKTKTADDGQSQKMGVVASYLRPAAPSAALALWAEDNDISAKDLAAAYGTSSSSISLPKPDQKDHINEGISPTADAGKYLSIDCEMVGVGPTPDNESALARVSIVNYHGHQIYDSFVHAKEQVTDYRTFVSGITPKLLQQARTFETVQADVAQLLDGKILIGHSVKNDLEALLLGHPKRDIRDTSRHPAYRQLAGGKTPGLKRLAKQLLGIEIQGGEHSSIEDARATMLLFRREKDGFEREHQKRWGPSKSMDSATNAKKAQEKRRKKKRKDK